MKPFPKLLVAVLALLSAGLSYAAAQGSPSSAQPPAKKTSLPGTRAGQAKIDPAKAADIRRLLELVGTKALMMQTMESSMSNMKPMLSNALPPGDYREKLVDLFFAKFKAKADIQQLLDLAVSAYDKHFSAEEIKGLIKFYETPLGQKSVSVLPQLVQELGQAGQTWGESLGRDCMQQVLAERPELVEAMEDARKAEQTR